VLRVFFFSSSFFSSRTSTAMSGTKPESDLCRIYKEYFPFPKGLMGKSKASL